MPTVTIDGPVTLQDTAKALQDNLGGRFEVTTEGSEELKVKRSIVATATVHMSRDGNATTFRIHGGGLIVSRLVNEMGIAKKVAGAIKASLGSRQGI